MLTVRDVRSIRREPLERGFCKAWRAYSRGRHARVRANMRPRAIDAIDSYMNGYAGYCR